MAPSRKWLVPIHVVLLLGGIYVFVHFALRSRPPKPPEKVVVAVIDTGLNVKQAPELVEALHGNAGETAGNSIDDDGNGFVDDVTGWSFLSGSPRYDDDDGHGTRVALSVLAACPKCRLLPIQVSRSGAGVRAAGLADAIAYAVARGASVINVSFGVTEGSDSLRTAVMNASRSGSTVVAAAGTGIPNPFQPVRLSTIHPQSHPDVITVGAAVAIDRPSGVSNLGPEMDVAVIQPGAGSAPRASIQANSSLAAGTVSGWLAARILEGAPPEPAKLRHLLRSATAQGPLHDPDRLGFGLLLSTPAGVVGAPPPPQGEVTTRVYRVGELTMDLRGGTQPGTSGRVQLFVEASAGETIVEARPAIECGKNALAEPIPSSLAKGRAAARFSVPLNSPDKDAPGKCRASFAITLAGGSKVELPIEW